MQTRRFIVAAVGPDQTGIVAEVTRVFLELGCNLEDTSMTVLRGQFAMMLVVAAPPELRSRDLEAELSAATAVFGLIVSVWEIAEDMHPPEPAERWSVSVHGTDRPGIVHGVSRALAAEGLNIVDLRTRIGGQDESEYAMDLDVTLPPGADTERIGQRLEALSRELGVACTLRGPA